MSCLFGKCPNVIYWVGPVFFFGGGSLISEGDVHVSLASPNQRSISDTSHEKMEYPKIGGQKVTWHVPYVYAPHPRPVLL